MSDSMRPIPFGQLMDWVLTEYAQHGTVFGVSQIYRHTGSKTLPIFTERIETPFGPAAGPHTQLAQNLIAAYAGGGRFFEVKTVQVIDGEDLPVSKPCIRAEDEGYNVEWSTELRVEQALEEYVKAWFALKLLSRQLELGSPDGFVFNMSVGYDLAGIRSEKVERYMEGMKDASQTPIWAECQAWARANLDRLDRIDPAFLDGISPHICTSITLSTLHGCPPDEIERIARYLIEEKGLNTYVKCNPTLLGYEFARKTLDDMGYDYVVFDERHFKADLQFGDAVLMFRRLLELCEKKRLEFGVKLTNTFPVSITEQELPGEEMYMSGKSLYPLSINLARRLEEEFGGKLRASYSGGADQFNIGDIFSCGVWPITVATTLLKPGGYNRLAPMARKLSAMEYRPFEGVDLPALTALAERAAGDGRHRKPVKPLPLRKLERAVPLIDCFTAPCSEQCPIHQDIPEYIRLVGQGEYAQALAVICEKNPLPFITGSICAHGCMSKCTRNFYEEPVHIRDAKLEAAEKGFAAFAPTLRVRGKSAVRAAVVGGGPAGMAAAHLLAREGAQVTLFEKRDALGGVVRHVIPSFRIADRAIENDASMLDMLGVEVRLNTRVDAPRALLEQGYTHVIVATGAWEHDALELEGGRAVDALDFLERQKKDPDGQSLGKNVAVIGGGNTAMDAARAAKRAGGVEQVRLVYRRTRRYMPADGEELALALADGVEFCELMAPVSLKNGRLACRVMELGAPDASGRRSPRPTGRTVEISADTVISAIGEKPDTAYFEKNGIPVDRHGWAAADEACRAGGLYVIGDARRGPALVVQAMADAAAAVRDILQSGKAAPIPFRPEGEDLKARRALLREFTGAGEEAGRCLGCCAVCESCADVCPNRANLAVRVPGMEQMQIVHIDKLCNECGNCAVFCPYDSAPYRDKFTLFASEADMAESQNAGFCVLDRQAGRVRVRLGEAEYESVLSQDRRTGAPLKELMKAVLEYYAYCL